MSYPTRTVGQADVEAVSALVQLSFKELAAPDWEPNAREVFLAESSPTSMRAAPKPVYALAAFDAEHPVGFILMPTPAFLGLLFVHPQYLRRGIGRALWDQARAFIEETYPDTQTVETNSTPYAFRFYRAIGFVPISSEFIKGGCRATRMACWLPARSLGAHAL
jgi:ribosomal protein S18 acetylase RimI-like enzyme